MTTIAKAADVIDSALPVGSHITKSFSESAAKALAGAGLLMPDLPEPNNYDYGAIWDQVFAYQSEPDWHDVMGYVASYDGVVEIVGNDTHIHTPDEARELAYALLAAANQAEKDHTKHPAGSYGKGSQ